jgi:hypothetical protein
MWDMQNVIHDTYDTSNESSYERRSEIEDIAKQQEKEKIEAEQ